MLQNLRKRNEGFTIIEVLIVLAIAGLILLVVFLAVPALQRNARNTEVKNAAAAILGAANEFSNNNNGQLPTTVAVINDEVEFTGAAGTVAARGKIKSSFAVTIGTAMPATTSSAGTFVVKLNSKCNNAVFDTANTPRAVAVGYIIEGGSGKVTQCTES